MLGGNCGDFLALVWVPSGTVRQVWVHPAYSQSGDVSQVLGLLGASSLLETLTHTGARAAEKLVSEGLSGEGGPLLLSTGKLGHRAQNCSGRPQESDTSFCFEGPGPSFACSPTFLTTQPCFFLWVGVLSTIFLAVGPWEGGREGRGGRNRMKTVLSAEPPGVGRRLPWPCWIVPPQKDVRFEILHHGNHYKTLSRGFEIF